jgi:hypothetical protein
MYTVLVGGQRGWPPRDADRIFEGTLADRRGGAGRLRRFRATQVVGRNSHASVIAGQPKTFLDDLETPTRSVAARDSGRRGSPRPSQRCPLGRRVLVGEVAYRNWSADGRLRHPSWRGLRPDRATAPPPPGQPPDAGPHHPARGDGPTPKVGLLRAGRR